MLQIIHDKLRGIFAVLILGALGVVFIFWGVEVKVGGFTKSQGLSVNGEELKVEGVRRQYQEEMSRYQAAFGAAGVPEELRKQLQTRALDQAVLGELVRQRTRKLRFVASDRKVLETIQQIPAFQVDGKFSSDAYHAALRSAAINPAQFEAEQRQYAVAQQLDRGMSSSTFVLPVEIDRRIALLDETREIAWVVIPAAEFQSKVSLDEAALKAYYDGHQSLYMTEEQAAVEYIELNIDSLAASAAVSEAQLREYYDANKERYSTTGRRRARHILIAIKDDEAAAEAKARMVYDRARKGEDFAALAREFSDDAGSAKAGGDLGWALRGDFVVPFGDAVWDMKPGQLHEPVRSEFGWHVIRLEEAEADTTRSFEEVRAQIEPEVRRAEVEKLFGDQQEMLDTLAFESAGNLSDVSTKLKLPVKRVERFTRAGGGELGAKPALIEAVFAPEVLSGSELRTVELGEGRVVAVRVASHDPARVRPFGEVREQVVAAARLEGAQRQAAEKAVSVSTELTGGADWAAATKSWRIGAVASPTYQARLVRRDDTLVPTEIRDELFHAARPEGRARFGTAKLGTGDAVVWMVSSVRPGTIAVLGPADREAAVEAARKSLNISDAAAYIDAMRAKAEVDVNPQLFD
jgi:peptidyl-prolyl cis-trans isomerase D